MTLISTVKATIQKHLLAFYIASLAILIAIPLAVIFSPPELIFVGLLPFFWLSGFLAAVKLVRDLGKSLSRNTSHDSVLLFRYALLGFFGVLAVSDLVNYLTAPEDVKTTLLAWLIFTLTIVGLNVLGIYIHLKKRVKIIKNVRKDELFQ